jgi:hypothetical protein
MVCSAELCCSLDVVSIFCHKDVELSCPYLQSGCRTEWIRAKDNRYKMKTEMPSFSFGFSEFKGPSKESVLFGNSSLNTSGCTAWLLLENIREQDETDHKLLDSSWS